MTNQSQIKLRRGMDRYGSRIWYARFAGPIGAEVRSLFGGDEIPTGFMATAPGAEVMREIQDLNPGVKVTLEEE